jgi:N-acetylglutamate synthase-like GNAT family acetyltransferase
MVSGCFLSQGRKWRGAGRFARRYSAAWLHVRTLAVAVPVRGQGFGRELMKRAETYAVERGCTDAFLDTFSFQARPFYEKLGYRVFGTLENHPVGHQYYCMTKSLGIDRRYFELCVFSRGHARTEVWRPLCPW